METTLRDLRMHDREVARKLAEARSAANLRTRQQNEREEDNRVLRLKRSTHRRLKAGEREAESWFRGRIRVKVNENDQPRLGIRTPRKLHSRADPDRRPSAIGGPVFTGPDGFQSIHFQFTARGLAGSRDRSWRRGEAATKLQYIARYEALEDGAAGFWSNVAEDRAELAAFGKVIEQVERHDRKNANVYCEEIIALPCELTAAQRRECVRHICADLEARGLPFAVGMHKPDPDGDQRNFHCHIVYSLRPAQRLEPFVWDFETRKVGDINTPEGIRARRKAVTTSLNVALAKSGIAKRYTDKSHAARGISATPGRKRGQALTAVKRREERELLRRLEAIRELEMIATETANTLDRATAGLRTIKQETNARVRQMLNSVRLTLTEILFDAPSVRMNLENARVDIAAKVAAAQHQLENPRDLIRSQIGSARETVTAATARLSEIKRHRDSIKAMQPVRPKPASVAGAAPQQISKPIMPPPPPPLVAKPSVNAADYVPVVDIRSLEDEPEGILLPGLDQPYAGEMAGQKVPVVPDSNGSESPSQLLADVTGEASETRTNSLHPASSSADASASAAEDEIAETVREQAVPEHQKTESFSAPECDPSPATAPKHGTTEARTKTSGTPHSETDHSQDVERAAQAKPISPAVPPSPLGSTVDAPVHVSPIVTDDVLMARATNGAANRSMDRFEVAPAEHSSLPQPSVDAASASVGQPVTGARPSSASTQAIIEPRQHSLTEPPFGAALAESAKAAREPTMRSDNDLQQDADKDTLAEKAAKVREGDAAEAALQLSETRQRRLLEILDLIRAKTLFVTRRASPNGRVFHVAGLDDDGLEFLRSDEIRTEAEPDLRAIQLTQIKSLKPAWEWLRINVQNPDVLSFEGHRIIDVGIPKDIRALLETYVRHPLITRQLSRGVAHQTEVETTVEWIRTHGQDPERLILAEAEGGLTAQVGKLGDQIKQLPEDPRIRAALKAEYARRKAAEAEEAFGAWVAAKNRDRGR